MKKGQLSAREKAEINSLVEASHEALVETAKALHARQARRMEERAQTSKTG